MSLAVLLMVSVLLNILEIYKTPQKITLLIFGALISIGIGNTVLNPGTSFISLDPRGEDKFRRQQIVVGFIFSLILGLTMILEEVRNSPIAWLFFPIIALPVYLWIAEKKKRRQR
jgi:hypothetical protein